MKKLIALLLFIAIEIVLLPITLIGVVWFYPRMILTSRRGAISATAYEPLIHRWLLHKSGARKDEAGEKLLMSLPAASPRTMRMMLGPSFLAGHLSGLTQSMLAYPAVRPATKMTFVEHRTEFFDKALLDHMDKVKQVVILGAGWDTRAYNLPNGAGVRVFEVDMAETQRVKREALQKASIDAAHVTFVTADFNKEPWLDSPKRHGFDPDLRTFFLWEGVVYYLEADAVYATLEAVGSQCASGSAIAFDYFSREMVEGSGGLVSNLTLMYFRAMGEPLLFGIPTDPPAREQITNMLEAHSLKLARYEPLGEESANKKPFAGLALAITASTQ